jgi:hypothetical protein
MTTRERLLVYREIQDEADRRRFLEENKHDQRFVSIVELEQAFLEALRKRLGRAEPF